MRKRPKSSRILKNHPQVEWVNYPALPDSPYKALIDRDYGGKASGLLSFGIKGGREAGAKFIDALQLFLRLGEYRRCQIAGYPSCYNDPPSA